MKKEIPVLKGKKYQLEIIGMGHSAEGVGKYQEFTVFVPYALPGEEAEVLITEVKKSYARGKLVGLLKKNPARVVPPCDIYYKCGGCQMQHIRYEEQLKLKRQTVADAAFRIGHQESIKIHPTLGAAQPWNYRNKMQFPIGKNEGKVAVGCYAQGTHDIIPTSNCLIQNEANNRIASAVRTVAEELSIDVYDEKSGTGVLRHVIGRVGADGEVMAILVTNTPKIPRAAEMIDALQKKIPGLVSIQQNINAERTNVIMGKRTKLLWGKETIKDQLGGFSFHISAKSFFQVNTRQAEVLYQKALEYADLQGNEIVVDAYCGTGTITLFLARQAQKVYGIEVVEPAIIDARKNARENEITNVEFIVGDAVEVIPDLYEQGIRPDVIVVDPPRAGCDKKVLKTFADMQPQRIVYVSCNPASLARDIETLSALGYAAKEIQPVDMFSHTSHVECVCLMSRVDK